MIKLESPKVEYLDHMGSDVDVANAARVSFAKETEQFTDKEEKLIKYLAKHGHWTPFGHQQIKFRITNPIFLARQLVKHQVGGVWNEESRRYISDDPTFYIPDEWHKKPEGYIKQGSGKCFNKSESTYIKNKTLTQYSKCLDLYEEYLKMGMAPEQARMILPLGTNTHWIWTGSLYFWFRVYQLRSSPYAQKDLKSFCKQLDINIDDLFPVSWKALKEYSNGN